MTRTIDGSQGEGGGQILRTTLALSVLTGEPIRLENIRARRKRPGLLRQHLTAVRAAAAVGGATLDGAELGAATLTFEPHGIYPGHHHFDVGTAGSATLVLQTILPPLAVADGPSEVVIGGGTHNSMAPPFDFLARSFAPQLREMGVGLELELTRHGFYPAGGGQLVARITPAAGGQLRPLELTERGPELSRQATAVLSKLPRHIARRELDRVREVMGWPEAALATETVASPGPGNVLMLEVAFAATTILVTGFGRRGVPAERVAELALNELRATLDAEVPVCEHLADQLLLPFALAGGGRLRTVQPSLHSRTNADVIRDLIGVATRFEQRDDGLWDVVVG